MKAGDLIKIEGVRNYDGEFIVVGRLLEVDDHSVKVIVEGVSGYFIFSKDNVVGVIDEVEKDDDKKERP